MQQFPFFLLPWFVSSLGFRNWGVGMGFCNRWGDADWRKRNPPEEEAEVVWHPIWILNFWYRFCMHRTLWSYDMDLTLTPDPTQFCLLENCGVGNLCGSLHLWTRTLNFLLLFLLVQDCFFLWNFDIDIFQKGFILYFLVAIQGICISISFFFFSLCDDHSFESRAHSSEFLCSDFVEKRKAFTYLFNTQQL